MSMTIEEAIEKMQYFHGKMQFNVSFAVHNNLPVLNLESGVEAYAMAIEALKEKAERENPTPLTIEELVQMDGVPVWIKDKHSSGYEFSEDAADYFEGRNIKEYGKAWIAYRNKPKET